MLYISRRDLLSSAVALSASSLVARSAWGRTAGLLAASPEAASAEALAALAAEVHTVPIRLTQTPTRYSLTGLDSHPAPPFAILGIAATPARELSVCWRNHRIIRMT